MAAIKQSFLLFVFVNSVLGIPNLSFNPVFTPGGISGPSLTPTGTSSSSSEPSSDSSETSSGPGGSSSGPSATSALNLGMSNVPSGFKIPSFMPKPKPSDEAKAGTVKLNNAVDDLNTTLAKMQTMLENGEYCNVTEAVSDITSPLFKTLRARVTELETSVTSFETSMTSLVTNVANVQGSVASTSDSSAAEIKTLKQQLDSFTTWKTSVTSQLSNVKATADTANQIASVAPTADAVNNLKDEVANLKTLTSNIPDMTLIDDMDKRIEDLKKRVDAIDAAVTGLSSQENTEPGVTAEQLSAVAADVAGLSDKIGTCGEADGSCPTVLKSISSLWASVNSVTTSAASSGSLQSDLDALQGEVDANKLAIETLQSDIQDSAQTSSTSVSAADLEAVQQSVIAVETALGEKTAQSDFATLSEEVAAMHGDIETLNNAQSSSNDNSALQTNVDAINNDVTSLKTTLETLQQADTETAIAGLQAEIDKLKEQTSSADASVSSVSGEDLIQLQNAVATLQADMPTKSSLEDISALQGKLATAEADIKALQEQGSNGGDAVAMAGLQEKLTTLETEVTGLKSSDADAEIAQLKVEVAAMGALSGDVEGLRTSITTLQDADSTIETNLNNEIAKLKSSISSLESKMATMDDDIDDLAADVEDIEDSLGPADCPGSYTYNSKTNMCIYIVKQSLAWTYAKSDCESFNDRLAVLDSYDKMNFVSSEIKYKFGTGARMWVGGTGSKCGEYLWVDGSPLNKCSGTWASSPPGATSSGVCVALKYYSISWYSGRFGYYAENCGYKFYSVCEKVLRK